MDTEQSSSRELTPSERGFAVAMGIGMLLFSLMALVAMVALYLPLLKITEGLSK